MCELNSNLLKKINFISNSWVKENILINEGGAVRISYDSFRNIFNKSHLFSIRIVGKIIQTVGGNEYPPKRKKTFKLISSMFEKEFKSKSLGNVIISQRNNNFFFVRENRNLNYEVNIKENKCYLIDGRFLVFSQLPGKLFINHHKINMTINPKSPFNELNYQINKTIPCLQTLEGKTIRPHLKTIEQNSVINQSKENCFNLYLINRILI